MTEPVAPPRETGPSWPQSGNSSESISIESPIFTSPCITVPPGPGIRTTSTAPNAFT